MYKEIYKQMRHNLKRAFIATIQLRIWQCICVITKILKKVKVIKQDSLDMHKINNVDYLRKQFNDSITQGIIIGFTFGVSICGIIVGIVLLIQYFI